MLMDEHALTDRASYGEAALSVRAEYTSQQANRYLDLLLAMDQLLMRIDALWLSGLVEAKQRASRGYEWQRRLIKLANRVRDLGDRARRYLQEEQARRAGKAESKVAGDGADAEQDASSIEPEPAPEARPAVAAEYGVDVRVYVVSEGPAKTSVSVVSVRRGLAVDSPAVVTGGPSLSTAVTRTTKFVETVRQTSATSGRSTRCGSGCCEITRRSHRRSCMRQTTTLLAPLSGRQQETQ